MEDKIREYLVNEKHIASNDVMEIATRELLEHDDIKNEFLTWLDQRNYDFVKPIKIEGYTAKDIYQIAPFLDGIGIFNFMVDLRVRPAFALKTIKEGFPHDDII